MPRDVVIVGAARTPIGKYGGALRDVHPAELGAVAARAAIARAGVDASDVQEVIIGHARQAGSGPNPARQVGRRAGLPDEVPALTVNQACASGMQAVAIAAERLAAGDADVALAGGIESMSRMPHLIDSSDGRWGHRLGHFPLVDAMYRDGFVCSLSGLVMGETAEILARQYGIARAESDTYASESHARAIAAIDGGRFADEIVPVPRPAGLKACHHTENRVRGSDGDDVVAQDEHPRRGVTPASLAGLPLAFPEVEGEPGIITAGSASGITDGGAALALATAEAARARRLTPLARIVAWATAGVDPRIMGIGPVPAVRRLLAKTTLSLDDFDLVELNEAFAPQVLAVLRDLPIPLDRLNVNGGAIALGHPIGCTGARILVTLVHEMRRRRAHRGLATLCVSGGLGMAMALELVLGS